MNHLTPSQLADRAVVAAEQALHAASCRAKNDRSAQAQDALAAAEHARRVAIARAEREVTLERCVATCAAAQSDASAAGRAHADASQAAVCAERYGDARKLAAISRETFSAWVDADHARDVADRQYRDALAARLTGPTY